MAPQRTIELRITEAQSPLRLDQALLAALQLKTPTLSRARLKTVFRDGKILYRGSTASPSQLLTPGSHEVTLLDWEPAAATEALTSPQGSFLPMIYEDADLLVLNKSSGVPSVPHSSSEGNTAVGAALAHFPGLRDIGRGGLEPGLLHRLDTGTSGLLAFAKTASEYERLSAAWRDRQIRKIYRALAVIPEARKPQTPTTWKIPLGHDIRTSKRMISLEGFSEEYGLKKIRGKPLLTITHAQKAELVQLTGHTETLTDFQIEIETGVMHQIRCVLASQGYPLLGDSVYGGPPSSRLWLHAWRLMIPHKQGTELRLEAPLPEGWPKTVK